MEVLTPAFNKEIWALGDDAKRASHMRQTLIKAVKSIITYDRPDAIDLFHKLLAEVAGAYLVLAFLPNFQ